MSSPFVVVKCSKCGKEFEKLARHYKDSITRGVKNYYCSVECTKTGKDVPCEHCGTVVYRSAKNLKRAEHYFCSKSCSNRFYGSRCEGETKLASCKTCSIQIEVGKQSSLDNVQCEPCRASAQHLSNIAWKQKSNGILKASGEMCCSICSIAIETIYGKYCEACLKQKRTEAGLKSVASQQRRSKNEVAFGDAISSLLECELLFNEPFFKDNKGTYWDADMIIPDLKLAIHWNGPWHYKEISKKVSLLQIQTRDKIKHAVIENNGFTNYVIRDDGKHDEQKVADEVKAFVVYVETLNAE
jgi:hypothetical protein